MNLFLSRVLCSTMADERPQATWPPPAGPFRVLIDTDAACEIEDQCALALALGFPERIKIEGLVAAHFGKQEHIDKSP